jgi:hypothetical protein
MTPNSGRPSPEHLVDDQYSQMERLNNISSASGFEPASL